MQPPIPSYQNMQSNTQQGVPGSGNFNGNPNTVYNRTPGPFYNPSQPWGPNNGLQYNRQPDSWERMYQAGYTNVRPMPNASQHYLRNQPPRQTPGNPRPENVGGRPPMPFPNFGGGNTVNPPPSSQRPPGRGGWAGEQRVDLGLSASPAPYGQDQNPWWQTFGFPVGQNAQPSNPYAGEQKPGQPNVMPKPGMDQIGNKPAPNTQPSIFDYGNYPSDGGGRGYNAQVTVPGPGGGFYGDPGRSTYYSPDGRVIRRGEPGFPDQGGTPNQSRNPNDFGRWNSQGNSIDWGGSGLEQDTLNLRRAIPDYPPQWNRRNDFPMPNFSPSYGNQFGYGFSGDSQWNQPWMGGQNANLGRYAPPMFDMSGRGINQGQGGYAYNLPNAYGPFPMFSQFGMGNNFRTPWPYGG